MILYYKTLLNRRLDEDFQTVLTFALYVYLVQSYLHFKMGISLVLKAVSSGIFFTVGLLFCESDFASVSHPFHVFGPGLG